ncbi:MAG TPA: ribosome-associated translation inhibitor RaiA [Vicinamibacterales bacterium]|nr:ribosome-associated translation inhibitor RaiA [Vicinamibacterales bacterium]
MRIDITGRHTTVTPALEQLITRRLGTLKKVLNDAAISALVIVTKEKYRHKVEMAIHTRGDHTLSGTAEANSWPLAVRMAATKIEQQAKKLKGKWTDRKRQAAKLVRNRKTASEPREPAPAGESPRVVRATRYPVKPMSVEDAALRMEEGDDAFLVFRHADDDSVAILYRRKDGNLGLIQP